MDLPRPLSPRYLATREAMHRRFIRHVGQVDPSALAYLRGPSRSWTEEELVGLWRQAAATGGDALNHVYVHVPFCKSICTFCNYERLRPSHPDLLRAWLDRTLGSLEALAPAVAPLTFHSLYLGGGTPSVLPPEMMDTLLTALGQRLRFHERAARHVEFDPAVLNDARIEVLMRHGFTRWSFGIQSLDRGVNEAHNRGPQDAAVVARRFEALDRHPIERISCDFLLGLDGTTPEGILDDVALVIGRHKPDRVDLFFVVPTPEYLAAHFGGSREAFEAHIAPFRERVPPRLAALAATERYDLRGGSGHHLSMHRHGGGRRREVKGAGFTYNQLVSEQERPLNLLGLGPSARSQLFGVASVQTRDPGATGTDPGPAWYEGQATDLPGEAVTWLAHHLRDHDRVDGALFQRIFGQDLAALAPVAVAAWRASGLLTLEGDDAVLPPQDAAARLEALLWLVPDAWLEEEVARHLGLQLSAAHLARGLAPLAPGVTLAGGVVLEGFEHARLRLRLPDGGALRLRVGPGLEEGAAPRLVVEGALSPEVAPAVRQLQAALRRLLR